MQPASPTCLDVNPQFDGPREGGGRREMAGVHLALHLLPFLAFWTGVTWFDVGLCFLLLVVRGFCVSAGYHRYLSHRSFRTRRFMRFLLAAGGCTALRGGPLWWAALHRYHHRHADTEADIFSPRKGLWWSYYGWLVSGRFDRTPYELVRDLARCPELRWLNRWWLLPPVALALGVFLIGGWSALAIGFGLSTVLLFHMQAGLDALNHLVGFRRYATPDTSRNNVLMAFLAMGEGWHNNHHHYPNSANSGFFWYEADGTYTGLRLLALVGLVWDLKTPPPHVLTRGLEVSEQRHRPSNEDVHSAADGVPDTNERESLAA